MCECRSLGDLPFSVLATHRVSDFLQYYFFDTLRIVGIQHLLPLLLCHAIQLTIYQLKILKNQTKRTASLDSTLRIMDDVVSQNVEYLQ